MAAIGRKLCQCFGYVGPALHDIAKKPVDPMSQSARKILSNIKAPNDTIVPVLSSIADVGAPLYRGEEIVGRDNAREEARDARLRKVERTMRVFDMPGAVGVLQNVILFVQVAVMTRLAQ